MSPRRVLVGLMIVGLLGLVVGVLAFGDKPVLTVKPIPAAKFVPDFDPRAATPEEIRAQARRVFDELRSTIRSMPTGSQEQIKAKNEAFARLPRLAGRLGDMELALQVASEIPDPVLREGAPVRIAQGFRSSRNPAAIQQLADTMDNQRYLAEILYFLAWARAQDGDYAGTHEIAADPRLAFPSETLGDAMRPFIALNTIVSEAQVAGDFDAAREAARAAENYQREMQQTSDDPYWGERAVGTVIANYLRAREPEPALRLIDSLSDGDPSLDVDLDGVAMEQARRGNLEAAASTRRRMGSLTSYWDFEQFTLPARDLSESGQRSQARELLRQGIAEILESDVELGRLVEIALVQRHLGFVEDADETINSVSQLPRSPELLLKMSEYRRVVGELDQSRSLLDRVYSSASDASPPQRLSRLAQQVSSMFSDLGDTQAARQHLDIALQHAVKIEESRDQVLELCSIARRYAALGVGDASSRVFETAVEASDSIDKPSSRAWQYQRIGLAALQCGMKDRAFDLLGRTIRTDARSAVGFMEELCEELVSQGRVTAAITLARQLRTPTERARVLRETIEMLLAIAETHERDAARGAR